MKNNITPWAVALFTMLFISVCAGVASAQSYHGQMSVLMGDYMLPNFGTVSNEELGNQFHRISGDAFFSLNKRETLFAGAAAHSWSRGNTVVFSAAHIVKGRLRGDRMMLEFGAGPTVQYRGRFAPGFTIMSRGEFRLGCDDRTHLGVNVHAEVGNVGVYYDQALSLRHGSFEARLGVSSVSQGEYVQLNYFTSERYSIGLTYAWDRAINTLLESQGFGDYHRRALGVQGSVYF